MHSAKQQPIVGYTTSSLYLINTRNAWNNRPFAAKKYGQLRNDRFFLSSKKNFSVHKCNICSVFLLKTRLHTQAHTGRKISKKTKKKKKTTKTPLIYYATHKKATEIPSSGCLCIWERKRNFSLWTLAHAASFIIHFELAGRANESRFSTKCVQFKTEYAFFCHIQWHISRELTTQSAHTMHTQIANKCTRTLPINLITFVSISKK